jgi:hypothetical protein
MERLRSAGYAKPMTSLEEGISDYVRRYLSQSGPLPLTMSEAPRPRQRWLP